LYTANTKAAWNCQRVPSTGRVDKVGTESMAFSHQLEETNFAMLPAWSDCSWGFRTTPPALMPEEDPGTPRISRRRSWGVLDVDEAGFGDFRQATGEQTMNIWQASPTKVQRLESSSAAVAAADFEVHEFILQTPEPKGKAVGATPPPAPCAAQKVRQLQCEVQAGLRKKSVPLVQLALSQRSMLSCPFRCDHSLHEAVHGQYVDALEFLLAAGIKENLNSTCCGLTPLARAVRSITRKDDGPYMMASTLLRYKARPDVVARCGSTPLHDAVERVAPAAVNLLLAHRADPNATTRSGKTALHLACSRTILASEQDARTLVETLLHAGADPTRQDEKGFRPSDLLAGPCFGCRPPGLQALLIREERWWTRRAVILLREKGSDPIFSKLPEMLFQAVVRYL